MPEGGHSGFRHQLLRKLGLPKGATLSQLPLAGLRSR
jgi:hypothetical protein